MARKRGGMQAAVFQWAYQNKKQSGRTADVLKSIEEVGKTLDTVKVKKK